MPSTKWVEFETQQIRRCPPQSGWSLRPNRYVVARRGTHVAVPVVVAAVAVAAAGGVAILLLLLPFVFFAVVAPSEPQ